MPEETFQGLLLAAGPEAAQRLLALLHRSWQRLRGEVVSGAGTGQGVQSPCAVGQSPCDEGKSPCVWGYSPHQGGKRTVWVQRLGSLGFRAAMCEGLRSLCTGGVCVCVCAEPRRRGTQPVRGVLSGGTAGLALGLCWLLGAVSCRSRDSCSCAGAVRG